MVGYYPPDIVAMSPSCSINVTGLRLPQLLTVYSLQCNVPIAGQWTALQQEDVLVLSLPEVSNSLTPSPSQPVSSAVYIPPLIQRGKLSPQRSALVLSLHCRSFFSRARGSTMALSPSTFKAHELQRLHQDKKNQAVRSTSSLYVSQIQYW